MKKLIVLLITILTLSISAPVLATSPAPSASSVTATTEDSGYFVGRLTTTRTVVAPTALVIGLGTLQAETKKNLDEVRGGDIVIDKYHLLVNRTGWSILRFDSESLSRVILSFDRESRWLAYADVDGSSYTVEIPGETDVTLELIYRVPSRVLGKVVFFTDIYDLGEEPND